MREDNLLKVRHPPVLPSRERSVRAVQIYLNLATRMKLSGPNQLWIADITYIRLRAVRFSPDQEPEPFGRGLPCQSDQQWPNALRAAGDDPISTPRLHAASSRTRAAMRAMLGRVFLSVVDDRVLAKVLGPAPQSANCRGALQLLHAFNTANASRQIGAEETAVGGLVCQPTHSTEA